jgi:hypothetical protein
MKTCTSQHETMKLQADSPSEDEQLVTKNYCKKKEEHSGQLKVKNPHFVLWRQLTIRCT